MLLPEWHPQKAILLAWPDRHTDWYTMLDEAQSCYKGIINGLLPYIDVYLICRDKEQLAGHFTNSHHYQLHLIEADYKIEDKTSLIGQLKKEINTIGQSNKVYVPNDGESIEFD